MAMNGAPVALITGAAGGLGRAAVARLRDRGMRVVATDPGSMRDFQAFAKQTGNELVEQTKSDSEFIHVLRRR